jgi:enediyne biosynthesis protein E4
VAGARGYLSQSELPVTLGLGKTDTIDKVTVRWPGKDAKTEFWTNLKANTTYTLRQGKAEAEPAAK